MIEKCLNEFYEGFAVIIRFVILYSIFRISKYSTVNSYRKSNATIYFYGICTALFFAFLSSYYLGKDYSDGEYNEILSVEADNTPTMEERILNSIKTFTTLIFPIIFGIYRGIKHPSSKEI